MGMYMFYCCCCEKTLVSGFEVSVDGLGLHGGDMYPISMQRKRTITNLQQ
jgi:hypothetical protein